MRSDPGFAAGRRRALLAALAALGAGLGATTVLAHHSFAVFFDPSKSISVTGEVIEFQFKNPHGTLRLKVRNAKGEVEEWRFETNSPSILLRRGWTAKSLTVGETITVEGWPARDGSRYARMRKVTRANGEVVGKPFGPNDD